MLYEDQGLLYIAETPSQSMLRCNKRWLPNEKLFYCPSLHCEGSAPDGPDKASVNSKLKASSVLYSLVTGKYSTAALEFLQIGTDLGSSYNEVLCTAL